MTPEEINQKGLERFPVKNLRQSDIDVNIIYRESYIEGLKDSDTSVEKEKIEFAIKILMKIKDGFTYVIGNPLVWRVRNKISELKDQLSELTPKTKEGE